MELTDELISEIEPRNKPFKLGAGNGLFLSVQPNGSKFWRLKYRYEGKEKSMSLGKHPKVSLKDARDMTYKARKLLEVNVDPSGHKKANRPLDVYMDKLHDEYEEQKNTPEPQPVNKYGPKQTFYPQPFTEEFIASVQPKGSYFRYHDGGGDGLQLDVSKTGRKNWKVRVRKGRNYSRIITMGVYPDMSLADARQEAAGTQAKFNIMTVDEIEATIVKSRSGAFTHREMTEDQIQQAVDLKKIQESLSSRLAMFDTRDQADLKSIMKKLNLIEEEFKESLFGLKIQTQNVLSLLTGITECKSALNVILEEKEILL